MKLKHILTEDSQVRSYDEKHGKIMLDVVRRGNYVAYRFKGQLHRNDGKPAFVYDNGTKKWFVNGKKHREDGPAVEYESGEVHWYLVGKEYTEEEWKEKLGEK